MHRAATERLEFAPPPDKRSLGALALALFVHLLLIAALTWGVNWKHTEEAASFEAELWSASAQQAAPEPRPTQPAAEPEKRPTPPVPVPVPRPAPVPPPRPVKAPQARPAPSAHEADIALEKEKEKEKKRQQLAQKAVELEQAKKQEATLQAKELQKKKDQDLKAQQVLEKENLAAEKRHQDAINRMMGMADSGSAPKGPSAGYPGKVRAKVLPNVVFTDEITGNPKAEVEVRTTADGTIMSQRVINSSGNQAWNDAVIKALIRTGSLPRDVDGRVPTPMIIVFQPRN
jgi:colicin import membrane protein